jgi:hypothetical protein
MYLHTSELSATYCRSSAVAALLCHETWQTRVAYLLVSVVAQIAAALRNLATTNPRSITYVRCADCRYAQSIFLPAAAICAVPNMVVVWVSAS